MKAGSSFRCLFWAVLSSILYLITASEEDLTDFDFSDLKEIDWDYENGRKDVPNEGVIQTNSISTAGKKLENNFIAFEDELENEENANPFDWRERLMRMALAKALTNRSLRQKFVEVMPILRVLSSQQRLALSALISAQINARKGQELKLEQVRMMFGDDKSLLLPIVYDIANLVRNSARKFMENESEFRRQSTTEAFMQFPSIEKRRLDLTDLELDDDDSEKDVGVIDLTESHDSEKLDDFLGEMPEDVIDAKEINEELRAPTTKATEMANQHVTEKIRRRRAAEFVHKLIRSMPLSVNEDDLMKGAAGRTVKLNVTSFARPQGTTAATTTTTTPVPNVYGIDTVTPSYQQVEDMALSNLNGTSTTKSLSQDENVDGDEPLPSPEELTSGPRYRSGGLNKIRGPRPKYPSKRKRFQGRPLRPGKVPPQAASSPIGVVSPAKKCERFTASMCLYTEDYPLEQIMGSIRRHKNAMSALLAEYHHNSLTNQDLSDEFDEFQYGGKQRREDEATGGGGMCQSIVRYARPQKARSASGEWKYIVNTGQHTQTLRLEKCTNPQDSCSYLTQNYRSHCSQVYNYHRLLSWDKLRGLHVDIFKVPTCCSCQVDGYRQQFPPLDILKSKDFTPAYKGDGYSTINDELDYNDDDTEDDDDLSYQYSNAFDQHRSSPGRYDDNDLLIGGGSRKVQHATPFVPNPTVGSYLSPPAGSDDYDTNYAYNSGTAQHFQHHQQQQHRGTSAHLNGYTRRRPYKSSVSNEARSDLEISPSEPHANKEVKFVGGGSQMSRAQAKRQRIYSVPVPIHTASSDGSSSSSISSGSIITSSTLNGASSIRSHATTTSTAAAEAAAAATASTTAAISSTRGDSVSIASHAHEAGTAYTPATRFNQQQQQQRGNNSPGYGGNTHRYDAGKQRPKSRFRIPAASGGATSTTATATTAAKAIASQSPTESNDAAATARAHNVQRYQSSASNPSLYHVNAIFNGEPQSHLNGTSLGGGGGVGVGVGVGGGSGSQSKRINYSYHPIIDFFENNKQTPSSSRNEVNEEDSGVYNPHNDLHHQHPPHLHHHHHHHQRHSQRSQQRNGDDAVVSANGRKVGFSDGGGGGSGSTSMDDNAWHPMVARR